MRSLRLVSAISLVFTLALSTWGCVSTSDLTAASGGTVFEVHSRSYDSVWSAAKNAASKQLKIVEANKEKGELRAENGVSLTSNGEVVGIFVEQQKGKGQTFKVTVVSKTKSKWQLTGENWEKSLVDDMKTQLKL